MNARLLTVLAIFVAIGCALHGCAKDHRAFSSVDSWYSPAPIGNSFTSVSKDRFAAVTNSLQPEALAALADSPAQALSAEEAFRLTGKQLPAGGRYVLLRTVVLNEGTGGFDIGVNERAVYVRHGCLGRRAAPMTRKAIVAMLPTVPDTVYVSCSMAE